MDVKIKKMLIQCNKCGRRLNNPNWINGDTCKCGGYWIPINQNQMGNLGNQFEQIGNTFQDIRSNIPHLYISKQGISTDQAQNPYPNQNMSPQPLKMPQNTHYNPNLPQPIQQNQPYFNPNLEPDDFYTKLRKWGIWFLVSVVICYAGYRIILSFL